MRGSLKVLQSLVMVFESLIDLSSLKERLCVLWVQLNGFVQAPESVFVLFEFLETKCHVEIDSRVVTHIKLINFEALSEFINGCLELLLFEELARTVLQFCSALNLLQNLLDLSVVRIMFKQGPQMLYC